MVKLISILLAKLPSARVGAGSYRTTVTSVLVVLPLTLLLLESASAFSMRLAFSDALNVTTSKVYLNDILKPTKENSLFMQKTNNIVVASAPRPGKYKIIKKSQVLKVLAKHNLTDSATTLIIPDEIKVTRNSQVFAKKEIESLIRRELLRNNFINNENTAFTVEDYQKDVVLPLGDVRTSIKMPGKLRASNKFWISFYLNGKLKNRIWASGTIKRYLEVISAKNDITANQTIKAEDLVFVKSNILDLSGDYFTNERALIGKNAKINISEGSLFRNDSIDTPPLLKAGDKVNILASMKNMKISAFGKVLSREGSVGDRITVMNLDSNEKLEAIVLNNSTVKVEVR